MADHLVTLVSSTAEIARAQASLYEAANLAANVSWPVRERLRTIQGLASKLEDACLEMMDNIGTVESDASAIETIWGPFDESVYPTTT